jgi:chromosomal replication initiation ATPase DnaA
VKVYSATRTMANARQICPDEGFQRRTPRRDRLNALSREWEAKRQAKVDAEREALDRAREQAAAHIARWKRRRPVKPVVIKVAEAHTAHGDIIARVAVWHSRSVADIMGKSRSDPIVACRHDAIVAVYLNCRFEGKRASLTKLGRIFGIDHTSCLFALRKMGIERAGRPA